MALFSDDTKDRCGYKILSTDWVYKLLHKVGLSRDREDPFITACTNHDRITDNNYPYNNIISPERKQESFDNEVDEIDKDIHHPVQAYLYKKITKIFTRFFE